MTGTNLYCKPASYNARRRRMEIISTQRLGAADGGCRYCDARAYESLSWSAAGWPRHGDLRAIASHLRKETSLKWGTLFRCVDCRQAWYLDGDKAMAARVRAAEEPLLGQWSATASKPSPADVEILSQIRGAGGDRY